MKRLVNEPNILNCISLIDVVQIAINFQVMTSIPNGTIKDNLGVKQYLYYNWNNWGIYSNINSKTLTYYSIYHLGWIFRGS